MNTPPIQIRKFIVIFGELISFLSMIHAITIYASTTHAQMIQATTLCRSRHRVRTVHPALESFPRLAFR
jgi:hypothetical protein